MNFTLFSGFTPFHSFRACGEASRYAIRDDAMTVHSKDRIVFRLTCGTEIGV